MNLIDLTGQRFERLVVIERAGVGLQGSVTWVCVCDCGNEAIVTSSNLRRGSTRSCGCLQAEMSRVAAIGHGAAVGGAVTPEYGAWRDAKQRVTNPANKDWPDYGGRGITMADEWLNDYAAFLAHIGPRPDGKSLDRIDVNGNYEPGNVRWAGRSTQNRNKRSAVAHASASL